LSFFSLEKSCFARNNLEIPKKRKLLRAKFFHIRKIGKKASKREFALERETNLYCFSYRIKPETKNLLKEKQLLLLFITTSQKVLIFEFIYLNEHSCYVIKTKTSTIFKGYAVLSLG